MGPNLGRQVKKIVGTNNMRKAQLESVITIRDEQNKIVAIEVLVVGEQKYEALKTSFIGIEEKLALYNQIDKKL